MGKLSVYLVEPNTEERTKIVEIFIKNNYEVKCFDNATDLLCRLKQTVPDLTIINTDLNEMISGIELCKMIRDENHLKAVLVFLISDNDDEVDKILGFEMGADDYLVKPFSHRELLARAKAWLRKKSVYEEKNNRKDTIKIGDIVIDNIKREVTKDGELLSLTYKEFELLYILAVHKGQVLTRDNLLDKVWGYGYFGETRTVDAHIRNLRRILSDDEKKYIETIRGVGYKMKD